MKRRLVKKLVYYHRRMHSRARRFFKRHPEYTKGIPIQPTTDVLAARQ